MKVSVLVVILLGVFQFSSSSLAGTCRHRFTDPDQLRLDSDSVLIVTHPSSDFDGRMASKAGIDAAVRFAKEKHIPVIYLQDDGKDESYFVDDCNPDYWLYSAGGEFKVNLKPSHVFTVGGHWELCQSETLHDVLYTWAHQAPRDVTITAIMDAIYMKGSLSFRESDPYYDDYIRFLGIVNYGHPGSEAFNHKLTLLEAMGIIIRQDLQEEFLIRSLPHFERTMPDYRVEFSADHQKTKLLQKGKGSVAPTMRFELINSAEI